MQQGLCWCWCWSGTTHSKSRAACGVDLLATLIGALVTKPFSLPELDWSYAAPNAGLATATASEFQIKDGATVLWRCLMPANSAFLDITFPSPLRGTANTALNIQAVTVGSVVVANLQGYAAP